MDANSPSGTTALDHCTMCNGTDVKLCPDCNLAAYCSQVCQDADYPEHKLLCSSLDDLGVRPSPDHRRVILLGEDASGPSWMWMQDPTEVPRSQSRLRAVWIDENSYLLRPMPNGRELIIYVEDDPYQKYVDGELKRTPSVRLLVRGAETYPWSGPLILTHFYETYKDDYFGIKDITLQDFRYCIDFFRTKNGTQPRKLHANGGGVKIYCKADKEYLNEQTFARVLVPIEHPIWTTREHLPISKAVEFPIKLDMLEAHMEWKTGTFQENSPSNMVVKILTIDINPESSNWGHSNLDPGQRAGTGLAVRGDGRPLSTMHLTALAKFSEDRILPLVKAALKKYKNDVLPMEVKLEILSEATKEKFNAYFEELRSQAGEIYPNWLEAKGPFEK